MSYRVRLRREARRQVAGWHLPDGVLVDVYTRLQDDLVANPAERMVRSTVPFDGMTYTFPVIDRSNRFYGYSFTFLIRYSTDEETLWVVRGVYDRWQMGGPS